MLVFGLLKLQYLKFCIIPPYQSLFTFHSSIVHTSFSSCSANNLGLQLLRFGETVLLPRVSGARWGLKGKFTRGVLLKWPWCSVSCGVNDGCRFLLWSCTPLHLTSVFSIVGFNYVCSHASIFPRASSQGLTSSLIFHFKCAFCVHPLLCVCGLLSGQCRSFLQRNFQIVLLRPRADSTNLHAFVLGFVKHCSSAFILHPRNTSLWPHFFPEQSGHAGCIVLLFLLQEEYKLGVFSSVETNRVPHQSEWSHWAILLPSIVCFLTAC